MIEFLTWLLLTIILSVTESGMRRGVYVTVYGNDAFVPTAQARRAWDIDAGCWIDIREVDERQFVRLATDEDELETEEDDDAC